MRRRTRGGSTRRSLDADESHLPGAAHDREHGDAAGRRRPARRAQPWSRPARVGVDPVRRPVEPATPTAPSPSTAHRVSVHAGAVRRAARARRRATTDWSSGSRQPLLVEQRARSRWSSRAARRAASRRPSAPSTAWSVPWLTTRTMPSAGVPDDDPAGRADRAQRRRRSRPAAAPPAPSRPDGRRAARCRACPSPPSTASRAPSRTGRAAATAPCQPIVSRPRRRARRGRRSARRSRFAAWRSWPGDSDGTPASTPTQNGAAAAKR